MKKKIWRLSDRPKADDLRTLVEACILTKEEAKDIVLREEEEIPTDQLKEIKDEIKFLRGMILELSKKEPTVIYKYLFDHIQRWEPPIEKNPYWWGRDYIYCCSSMAKSMDDTKGMTVMNTMTSKIDTSSTGSIKKW